MSTSGVEREIKLAVSEQYQLPDLTNDARGVTMDPLEPQHLEARYLDTREATLLSLGATLRRRTGEGPTRWTLKLPVASPSGDLLERREVEIVDDAEAVPAALADWLVELVDVSALADVARLRTHRRRWVVRVAGRDIGELADDQVEGDRPSRPTVRFREIELELHADAPDDVVVGLTASLRAAGAADADPTPKLERVLRMTGGCG